jgi:hypothetical protein
LSRDVLVTHDGAVRCTSSELEGRQAGRQAGQETGDAKKIGSLGPFSPNYRYERTKAESSMLKVAKGQDYTVRTIHTAESLPNAVIGN